MTPYDPIESLREEVNRFLATNTFTPMLVTGFYVQAKVVLAEVDRLRAENEKLKAAQNKTKEQLVRWDKDVALWERVADKEGGTLGERCRARAHEIANCRRELQEVINAEQHTKGDEQEK